MKLMAGLKFLRGTAFNPFGRMPERVKERELISEYEATVGRILERLDPSNRDAAVALARVPETIRGFGPVKERSMEAATAKRGEFMAAFERMDTPAPLAG
jgi:indolepyruvate ferredoxin oxidoreductase